MAYIEWFSINDVGTTIIVYACSLVFKAIMCQLMLHSVDIVVENVAVGLDYGNDDIQTVYFFDCQLILMSTRSLESS